MARRTKRGLSNLHGDLHEIPTAWVLPNGEILPVTSTHGAVAAMRLAKDGNEEILAAYKNGVGIAEAIGTSIAAKSGWARVIGDDALGLELRVAPTPMQWDVITQMLRVRNGRRYAMYVEARNLAARGRLVEFTRDAFERVTVADIRAFVRSVFGVEETDVGRVGRLGEATSLVLCDRYGAWLTPGGTFHYVPSRGHLDYAMEHFVSALDKKPFGYGIEAWTAFLAKGYVRLETDVKGHFLTVDVAASPTDDQTEALSKLYRRCEFKDVIVQVWSDPDKLGVVRETGYLTYGIGANWARIRADINAALAGS